MIEQIHVVVDWRGKKCRWRASYGRNRGGGYILRGESAYCFLSAVAAREAGRKWAETTIATYHLLQLTEERRCDMR